MACWGGDGLGFALGMCGREGSRLLGTRQGCRDTWERSVAYPQVMHRWGLRMIWTNRSKMAMRESQDFHRIFHPSRPQLWRSWGLRECWDGWRVTVVDGLRGTGAVGFDDWDVPIRSKNRASDRPGLGLDAARQVGDLVEQAASFGHQLPDLAISVHDRGVIPTAEGLTDLR